ncbi:DUF928 domain-containing protein [Anabaena sp. CCY 0017]|uniref:DUF928 domain-containing protein n=1 Tax=Anabaena sp. CCY 0017 TaxID=3103866 RepID=UPI0039C60B6B
MKKTSTYIFLLILTLVLGDRYLIHPVAGQNLPKEPLQFNPPNNGAPGGNRSRSSTNTGSRDDCPAVEKAITALIPQTNWGNTLAERPTFWFYIPHKQGNLTLIIRDEETTAPVAVLNYKVSNGGGIVSFPIPENVPALEVNRAYRWRVYFTCNPNIQPSLTGVEGVVQRVATNEAFTTSTISIKEQIDLYASQGLWYETITKLIESLRSQPTGQELKQIWLDLLSHPDVELSEFISEPLVNCCNVVSE